MSLCPKCKIRPRVVYPSRKRAQGYCRECWSDRANQWRKKNKEHVKDVELKRKFGITLVEYDKMLALQNGVCAICKKPETTGRALAVDHNHTTKKVRALLCVRCNNGIGQLQENPAILYRAIEYLNSYL